ncbi:MAG: hypothetical protein RL344_1446 [Pseudomonadota bacterium]|jgi:uncharacterized phage-associated protein
MKKMYHPISIANKILELTKDKNITISKMKLLKLVYFCHGWHLGITGKPLSSELAEAWQYGPVFSSLYTALSQYKGADSIIYPIVSRGIADNDVFNDYQVALINKVIDEYGHLNAFQLSDLSHEDNGPWHKTVTTNIARFSKISNDDLAKHFNEKMKLSK